MSEPFSINKLDELVEYITTPPYHNKTQAAEYFGTSRAMINKILKELSTPDSLYYNEWKAKRVKMVLDELLKMARSRAGSKSKRKIIIDHDLALSLRYVNVYGGATLRDLASLIGCSHMTVCNAINNLSTEDLAHQDEQSFEGQEAIHNEYVATLENWVKENGIASSLMKDLLSEEQWKSR